jgi:hypothetical protein
MSEISQIDSLIDHAVQASQEVPPTEEVVSPLNDLAMDEPIFTGGPTRQEVEALKEQYPNADIMCVLLANGSGVVYRTMTRLEWKRIQELVQNVPDPEQRADIIFSKIVLFPNCQDRTIIQNLPAGVVTTVLTDFYQYAGFAPVAASLKL